MKKPPAIGTPEASKIDYRSNNTVNVIDRDASAQASNSPIDIAHVGAVWKSPRDKRACIQAGFKSYNSVPHLDLRLYEADGQGRMRPTTKGITVSPQRLMQLAKLVGDAARMAARLGLILGSSA